MASLSIVIPTHNRPALLPRAVASALANCPPEGEVLVVDDRSDPPARTALVEFDDHRLRIIESSESAGAAGTRNAGVAAAAGDVIFFLDDDDEMIPDYCARVVANAIRPCRARAGYAAYEFIDLDDSAITYRRRGLGQGVIPETASMRKRIAGLQMGFWIERALYQDLGGLNPALEVDEDTDLTLRLAARGVPIWYEPEPGVRQHSHDTPGTGGQLTRRTDPVRLAHAYLCTYQLNAGRFPLFHRARWFLLSRYLARAVKAAEARRALGVAITARPIVLIPCALLFLALKVCSTVLKSARLASH